MSTYFSAQVQYPACKVNNKQFRTQLTDADLGCLLSARWRLLLLNEWRSSPLARWNECNWLIHQWFVPRPWCFICVYPTLFICLMECQCIIGLVS